MIKSNIWGLLRKPELYAAALLLDAFAKETASFAHDKDFSYY